MQNFNFNLNNIRQSPTVELSDEVKNQISKGNNIIELQVGDPDFKTHKKIIDLTFKYLNEGYTHYTNSRGILELRNAISKNYKIDYDVDYDPKTEILVCNGGVHGIYCALASIVNKDDEVLIINPSWKQYSNIVNIFGGKPVFVDSKPEENFFPKIEDWKNKITNKTVAIILNSPNNPTGFVAKKSYLKKIVKLAKEYNLWIVSDEVYEKLIYDNIKYNSMCTIKGVKERLILINSFSKSYAMTGWRIGFILSSESIINLALKASQHTVTSVQTFSQKALSKCIFDTEVNKFIQEMVKEYESRRNFVKEIFDFYKQDKIKLNVPEGALYYFIDIRNLNISSFEAAKDILKKKHAAYTPGSIFGSCGEGFLRMTIASKKCDIEKGFKKFLEWSNKI